MKVYSSLDQFLSVPNPVVTIGTFDGVHLGHQKLISRLREIAAQANGETAILTFFPHPRMVLHPEDTSLHLLSTTNEKINLLRTYGIQHLIIQPFSQEFSRQSSEDFIRDILVEKLHVHTLVIGYDHRFGRNREGDLHSLQAQAPLLGFTVEEIPRQEVDHIAVSSTKIRNALISGDIALANSYLGHDYTLSGMVVKGRQIGRTLGYPTANLEIFESYKLIPANGIYACLVKLENETHKGMMSIGTNPTVNGTQRTIEVNLLNFHGDLYGKSLEVVFKARLRDEIKFNSLDDLVKQMDFDKELTIKLLS